MSSTTQLIYIPDWPTQLEKRLLVPWQTPKIRALARAAGDAAQILEDECFDLIASTGIYEAAGDALDQWGELVGEQRGPLSDNEYRQFILARMLCNRCWGTVEELRAILDIITEDNVEILHQDNFPAGFYLVAMRRDFMIDQHRRRVARMMEDVRPVAKSMSLVEAVVGGFGWQGDEDVSGWSDGPFADLIELE